MPGPRSHRSAAPVLLLAIGLVMPACGGEREADDGAAPTSGGAAPAAGPTTAAAPSTTTATTAAAGPATGDTPAGTTAPATGPATGAAPADMFGDLVSPCGAGEASGATAKGVTDDQITIGYGDDAGFASAPGLSHELSDAMKAIIEWCNEQGGVNGRTIEGTYYDAKVLDVQGVMTAACNDDTFMLVGQGYVLDSAQEQTRVGCGLGSVPGYAVSPEFAHGPLMVSAVPSPADFTPAQYLASFAAAFPDEIKRVGLSYANFPATLDTLARVRAAAQHFGYEFLDCDQVYGVNGEDDWRPLAQGFKDCGAEVVMFIGSPNPNFQNFLVAAAQLDYAPMYLLETNFYDQQFANWNADNGGAADNVYIRQTYVPLEEAADNPATQQYIDLIDEYGGDKAQLGEQAMSAFLLWARGVQACGSNVTRDCVFEQIATIEDWTGGGLHVATDPSTNMPPECGMVMKMNGGTFERWDPPEAGSFDCDPSYVQPVTGETVDRVKLGPDRVSTLFTP